VLEDVMRFEPAPLGPDRVVRGRYRPFPLPDAVAKRLVDADESIPPVFAPALQPVHRPSLNGDSGHGDSGHGGSGHGGTP
jgi:pilus assembly protein CpaF